MLMNFITDFKVEGEKHATRDLISIAKHYLKNGFWVDFIPLIPIQLLMLEEGMNIKLLYLPKTIRFIGGFEIFDVKNVYNAIKRYINNRITKIIETQPELAEDKDKSHHNIENQIKFYYGMKVLKLGLIIVNFSYFLGMFWIIFCELD